MSALYLISSLPMLLWNASPTLTPDDFLAACRAQLGPDDAAAAEALLRGTPNPHRFARAWSDKETILRNAVARQRARNTAVDAARWLRPAAGSDRRIESDVEEAFQLSDPLKREKALDRLRWSLADELADPDPLDISAVFSYAVKLAIAARWASLSQDRGSRVFEALAALPTPNILNTGHPQP